MLDARRQASGARFSKILLISYSYPPVLGGSEVEAQRVSSALIARGYQVEVLTGPELPMPQQPRWIDPCGVPVRILGLGWSSRWQPRIYALAVAWTLLRERKNYDIVYFLMQGLHLAVSLPITRLLGKPVVMKISGSAIIPRMRQSWLGRLELRWLRKWAHTVMILNDGMTEEAREAGLLPAQLLWMPNPVDVEQFAPASPAERQRLRDELGLRGPAAVFVGRLAPEKELPSLIAGFARALDSSPHATLVLVGDGPLGEQLKAQAAHLGIADRVWFAGRQDAAGVLRWLRACDLFALVSQIEGFSCSLTEAMAAGLPSVVSRIPGNLQLIEDQVHGLTAPVGDEAALGQALGRLFADEDLRLRMGAEARRRIVENYSTDRVIERYEGLFQKVLQQPRLGANRA